MPLLRILTAAEVAQALPMADAIAGMREAYAQYSTGQADVPLRMRLEAPEVDGVALFMPAYLAQTRDLALKVVSVFPRNGERGLPILHALVLALDAATGQPLAVLEGGALTAIRTGAGGGLSAEILARPDATRLALFGSGVQARAGLQAVCQVRPIREVRLFTLNPNHGAALIHDMAGRGPIPEQLRLCATPADAVRGADIVYCATTSATPVFDGADLTPGAHVIGVGSYTPAMQEVDSRTIRRALLVVDARASVLAEAGDVVIPLAQGMISAEHIHAEIGEIVAGLKAGRTRPDQITFFKSVGLAVQDAVAARLALANAARLGLGQLVAV